MLGKGRRCLLLEGWLHLLLNLLHHHLLSLCVRSVRICFLHWRVVTKLVLLFIYLVCIAAWSSRRQLVVTPWKVLCPSYSAKGWCTTHWSAYNWLYVLQLYYWRRCLVLAHLLKSLPPMIDIELTWTIELILLSSVYSCLHSLSFLSLSFMKFARSVSNWIRRSLS